MNDAAVRTGEHVPLARIAALFGRIGLLSFGGGLTAWVHRETVVQRAWIEEKEFLSALMLSQILPGSNVVNLAIYIGRRLRGRIGSVVAVCSLMAPPMTLVVVLAALCARFMTDATVHRFLEGIAAGAAGMTLCVGVRSVRATMQGARWPLVLAVAVMVVVGVMRWPLVPVVAVAAIVGLLRARRALSHAR